MSDLPLPAASSDLDIGNVIIDKAARPYVEEWFNDVKRGGDTPQRFLLRMIYEASIVHRARKLKSADEDTHRAAHENYTSDVDTDQATLLSQVENVLP